MNNKLDDILSYNLKRIREDRNLSLEKMSELTGVSKSMISQIENGRSNPTLATVYRITNALKISLSELTSRPHSDVDIVAKKDLEPLCEDSGKFRAYPVFPFDNEKRIEIFYCEIDGYSYHESEAHQAGTEEYITVFQGSLTIKTAAREYIVSKDEFIAFKANVRHSYANTTDKPVVFSLTTYYKK
jgi:transcriptional regulator with XRE-family HTH domain